ncbi:MAG: DUF6250 domain-containing protein [Bacteroidales bacterium]|nr:DUF6250 domain-containing protein [Bacteroidales bacterium]
MTFGTKIGIASGALVLLLGAGIAWLLSGTEGYPDGLNWKAFDSYWTVESESPDYRVEFVGEGVELTAPKGLTMWYKKPMEGDGVIEYDARVMLEREGDRLSDLNCFWKASDPAAEDIFARSAERGGKFANCATLQLYYVGYGGNYNSTTRFRRYNGMPDPALLREYTDPAHLLVANHWYHIRLVCADGKVEYWRDGELLFDYDDPEPLTRGWFGFRTTLARVQIKHFSYNPTN